MRAATVGPASCEADLVQYLLEVQDGTAGASSNSDAIDFWIKREAVYTKLAPIAEDLVAAPASEAYVERIFSVCGMLTVGRRNRMSKSLEMRVFLKLNDKILHN